MLAVLLVLFSLAGCEQLQDWSRDFFHDKKEEPDAGGNLGLGPLNLNFGGLLVDDPTPDSHPPVAGGHLVIFDSNGYNNKAQEDEGGYPAPYTPWIQTTIVNGTFTAEATPADVKKLKKVAGTVYFGEANAAGLCPLDSVDLARIFKPWTVIPDPDGGPSDTLPEGAVKAVPATARYADLTCDIGAPGHTISCRKGRIIVNGEPDYELFKGSAAEIADPDDDAEWVEYYYVDRDVKITASGNSRADPFTLELKKGWNAIHKHTEGTGTENGRRYYVSLGNPGYLPWIRRAIP
jgi:hypothetical protein